MLLSETDRSDSKITNCMEELNNTLFILHLLTHKNLHHQNNTHPFKTHVNIYKINYVLSHKGSFNKFHRIDIMETVL